jgi:glucose/mannose-6-phosphate isomerase
MLDDVDAIQRIDKSNLLDIHAQFPEQIQEALKITECVELSDLMKIDNVIISGMGGSGVTGDIIANLFRDRLDVPIVINREYTIPKWANKDTLTMVISYSGNTEETLKSFKNATQKKCKIIGISAGGKLQELCEKRTMHHIKIPTGFPPRAATAYLLFPSLSVLNKIGLIKNPIDTDIKETIEIITNLRNSNEKSIPKDDNPSKQLARKIFKTIPQIYGWNIYAPIARRWRTQFNENSKIIAREDIVPECNHNDIVGWSFDSEISKQFSCILFRDKTEESIYMSTRLDFMKTLFDEVAANTIEVVPQGKSRLAKMMYLMCLGDFVSCYLAVLRGVDPEPVEIIEELKNRLEAL